MVGNGIAVSIPIDGIGDESGMNYLLEGQEKCCNEVNEMDNGVNDAQYLSLIHISRLEGSNLLLSFESVPENRFVKIVMNISKNTLYFTNTIFSVKQKGIREETSNK